MSEYLQMSLRQSAQSDNAKGLKYQLTGWGRICKERHEKGISRKIRVRKNRADKAAQ